jgi:hypothetical protein
VTRRAFSLSVPIRLSALKSATFLRADFKAFAPGFSQLLHIQQLDCLASQTSIQNAFFYGELRVSTSLALVNFLTDNFRWKGIAMCRVNRFDAQGE